MPALNRRQLEDRYSGNAEFLKQFERLFTLRLLLTNCVVPDNYAPPPELGTYVTLSESGQRLFDDLTHTPSFTSESEAKVAIYLEFYHDDLLVDLDKCDAERIHAFLHTEIISGANIRFPWLFDRELYDRYFEFIGEPMKRLPFADTEKLLEGTSPGVFQLGNVVVGPFGLLQSESRRRLLPTRNVALWHCSDLSCQSLHGAELEPGNTSITDVQREISKILSRQYGRGSEWYSFYRDVIDDGEWSDDRNAVTLPWLIANAFTERELRRLLATMIDKDGKTLRPRLPQDKECKLLFAGDGRKVTDHLTKAQCLQLILLSSDSVVIRHIDQSIERGDLLVPNTETRRRMFSLATTTNLDISAECSRYGMRFISASRDLGTDRLRATVKHSYRDETDNLKWKLRHVAGDTVLEKLDRFIHGESPIRVLKDLILSDEVKTRRSLEYLDCGWINLPTTQADEDWLIERLLWKMGFDVPLYPVHQKQFWDRLGMLLNAARTFTVYNESDKEVIRSAAVNFFVSVEEILDLSLSFSTWMLLSDHFANTHYRFELEDAREFMASKLDGRQRGSFGAVSFESRRQNTLFPMVQGFALLADACEEILEDPRKYIRPQSELPFFVGKSRLYAFPFTHTVLVADTRTEDRVRILDLLRETTQVLESAQICDIRNRLEHKRDDFPQQSEIESACTNLAEAIRKLEAAGLSPSVYRFAHRTSDQFGRGQVTLQNYKGSEVSVPNPTQFYGCKLPGYGSPQIVVPWIHIDDSFEPIRFLFVERSEYSQRWKDYPRRVKRDQDVDGPEADSTISEIQTLVVMAE